MESVVIELISVCLSLRKAPMQGTDFAEQSEHWSQLEPNIVSEFEIRYLLRSVLQSCQRLLVPVPSFVQR